MDRTRASSYTLMRQGRLAQLLAMYTDQMLAVGVPQALALPVAPALTTLRPGRRCGANIIDVCQFAGSAQRCLRRLAWLVMALALVTTAHCTAISMYGDGYCTSNNGTASANAYSLSPEDLVNVTSQSNRTYLNNEFCSIVFQVAPASAGAYAVAVTLLVYSTESFYDRM